MEKQFEVFPNPFYSKLQITFALDRNEEINIQLYGLSGRMVYSEQKQFSSGKGNLIIDANKSGLKPGMYIYRLKAGNRVQSGKVVYRP
jgi:hypothetical protein